MKKTFLFNRAFLFVLFMAAFNAGAQHISETKLAEVNKIIAGFEKQGFSGSGLIAQNGAIVQAFHSGFADTYKKQPVTDSTRFNVASITKAFTAVAVMQLVEKGLLKLDDPITKFLGPVRGNASQITIHQLLSHQSGIGYNNASEGIINAEAAVKKIFVAPLAAKPGEKFIYSNDNYSLLALVIEKASKTSWQQYIQANILNPLAMRNTMFWDDYFSCEKPKTEPARKVRSDLKVRNYGYCGGTGMFSTTGDLLKFTRIFTDNMLLSQASIDLMKKEYVPLAKDAPWDKNGYGYGLFLKKHGDKEVICLRGTEVGWGNSSVYCFPQDKISLVVLSNTDRT